MSDFQVGEIDRSFSILIVSSLGPQTIFPNREVPKTPLDPYRYCLIF